MARRDSTSETGRVDVSAGEFEALFDQVRRWDRQPEAGRSRPPDHTGAKRTGVSAGGVVTAARLVREGVTVSLGRPLDTQRRINNPSPAVHRMTMLPGSDGRSGSVRFAKDYVGIDYHNDGHSHIDALCHVAYRGSLYGGRPAATVTDRGAQVDAIGVLAAGLVGRGVLLDVPRVRGVPWLEPGEHVFPDDLEAARRDQAVTVTAGDLLFVRTGHSRRQAERPPWDSGATKAGLHPTTAPLLAQWRVAALGSDGNSDTAPSTTEGVGFPLHVLAINAMGIYLLDYLQFEDLAAQCERSGRWEFLCAVAPLRIGGGTGSPVNPIAIF